MLSFAGLGVSAFFDRALPFLVDCGVVGRGEDELELADGSLAISTVALFVVGGADCVLLRLSLEVEPDAGSVTEVEDEATGAVSFDGIGTADSDNFFAFDPLVAFLLEAGVVGVGSVWDLSSLLASPVDVACLSAIAVVSEAVAMNGSEGVAAGAAVVEASSIDTSPSTSAEDADAASKSASAAAIALDLPFFFPAIEDESRLTSLGFCFKTYSSAEIRATFFAEAVTAVSGGGPVADG